MTDVNRLCKGASKAAWGYFFLFFNFDVNGFQILPAFVGYLLFLDAIRFLKDEERELSLLRGFAAILAAVNYIEWVVPLFGGELGSYWELPSFLCDLLALYFQFQFLTNLAGIAARYQAPGVRMDRLLLRCRTFLTVLQTTLTLCGLFLGELSYLTSVRHVVIFLLVLNAATGLVMMFALFRLRRVLASTPFQPVQPPV